MFHEMATFFSIFFSWSLLSWIWKSVYSPSSDILQIQGRVCLSPGQRNLFLFFYSTFLVFHLSYFITSTWRHNGANLPLANANIDPEQCFVYCAWPLIWPRHCRMFKMADISVILCLPHCQQYQALSSIIYTFIMLPFIGLGVKF